jgi:alcohol dehydrogenase (cytochrome c)
LCLHRAAELVADERRLRSTRYSRLTQINRDNVKNLRLVRALALGGMQDVGQNGPEEEVNPLIDNGFMSTTGGWGTVCKIDVHNPTKGELVWICDPGVRHEGNVSRTRGITSRPRGPLLHRLT